MEISLHVVPAHLWEIYERTYEDLITNTKKQFTKRIGGALFAILVFSFLVSIQSPYKLFISGTTLLFCAAYFFYKRNRIIAACQIQIEESKKDVQEWIDDISKYKKLSLQTEADHFTLVLDNQEFPYFFKDEYLLHMHDNFLYIQDNANTENSLMLPKKAMSNEDFFYLSEYLEKGFEK